jgi:hypothetical protein
MRKQSVNQLLALFVLFFSIMATPMLNAQTTLAPTPQFHIVVRYLKVEPGMGEDFKKTMAVWKDVWQQRKDKGEIRYWNFFKRTFPAGANSEYDYITVTAYNDLANFEMHDSYVMADWTKGLSKENAAILDNSNKVRKIVSRAVFRSNGNTEGGKPGKYIRVSGAEVKPGKNKEYLAALEKSNLIASEAVKSGKVNNRSTWVRVGSNSADESDLAIVFDHATLNGALAELNFEAEHKKVYPADDIDAYWANMRTLRDMMWTEVWERVDGTK